MLQRFGKRKMPPVQANVDYGLCHYCGACAGICPENAIFLNHAQLNISKDTCNGCKRCLPACPVHALFVVDALGQAPL